MNAKAPCDFSKSTGRFRDYGTFSGGGGRPLQQALLQLALDRKSTRLNSSHVAISYAVFYILRSTLFPYTTLFRSPITCASLHSCSLLHIHLRGQDITDLHERKSALRLFKVNRTLPRLWHF